MNFFVLSSRITITNNNTNVIPRARFNTSHRSQYAIAPHTSNPTPNNTPEINDILLCAFNQPIKPPAKTKSPYTIKTVAKVFMPGTLPETRAACPATVRAQGFVFLCLNARDAPPITPSLVNKETA